MAASKYVDDNLWLYSGPRAAHIGETVFHELADRLRIKFSRSKHQVGQVVKWLGIIFDFRSATLAGAQSIAKN